MNEIMIRRMDKFKVSGGNSQLDRKKMAASLPSPSPKSNPEAVDDSTEDESFDIANAVAAILEDASDELSPRTTSSVLLLQKHMKKKRKSKSAVGGSFTNILTAEGKPSKSKVSGRRQKKKGNLVGLAHTTGTFCITTIPGEGKRNEGVEFPTTATAKPIQPTIVDLKDEPSVLTKSISNISQQHHHYRSASTPAGGHKIHPPNPLPKNPTQADVYTYLSRVNSYINRLGYHHVGEPGIRVITHLSLRHHMETARQLIKSGENIKCLHALLLGIHLTNCTPLIERFPINFKSKLNGKEFRHVVLGIYLYGAYGALGLSRDPGLQDKPPTYPKISDLLIDYASSYEKSGHVLIEIKIGGIISRDTTAQCGIPWKIGLLHMAKFPDMERFAAEADKLAKLLKGQMGPACIRQLIRPSASMMARSTSMDHREASMKKHDSVVASATHVPEKTKIPGSIHQLVDVLSGASPACPKLSGIGSGSTIASAVKSTTGSKAKKKKVLKHKRFAEP